MRLDDPSPDLVQQKAGTTRALLLCVCGLEFPFTLGRADNDLIVILG